MIRIRKASERGFFDHGWLKTFHTFSFGEYLDPNHMGFRVLRVINEDWVAPGSGFPMHSHRDMEIITVVLKGSVEHRDSMGNHGIIPAGDVQRMSAGTGVRHSEFNPSASEPLHLYQIWILPFQNNVKPGYEQKRLRDAGDAGEWRLVASPDGHNGSVRIHQNASLYALKLKAGASFSKAVEPGRHAWVQVIEGRVTINQSLLSASDGAAISDEAEVHFKSESGCQLLFFDLP